MTRLRGPWTAAAAVTLFLLSACANTNAVGAPGESASPGAPGAVPGQADQLVLRYERVGGFAGNRGQLGKVPPVSVYADGRVITQGPQTAIYPGAALPNLLVQMAPPATVDALVAQGRALGAAGDLGRPGVSDGTTTRITVAGRVIEAYALGEAQPADPALTSAQRDARTKLTAFADQLSGLSAAKGMPAAQPYTAIAVAALAAPWEKPAVDLPSPPTAVAWPGPALPGAMLQEGGRQGCVTVTGADAGRVLTAAAKANQDTPWKSGPATWRIMFRPLLPDERSCADLGEKR